MKKVSIIFFCFSLFSALAFLGCKVNADEDTNAVSSAAKTPKENNSAARIFYFDSVGGDDAKDGRSEETALKSIGKFATVEARAGGSSCFYGLTGSYGLDRYRRFNVPEDDRL